MYWNPFFFSIPWPSTALVWWLLAFYAFLGLSASQLPDSRLIALSSLLQILTRMWRIHLTSFLLWLPLFISPHPDPHHPNTFRVKLTSITWGRGDPHERIPPLLPLQPQFSLASFPHSYSPLLLVFLCMCQDPQLKRNLLLPHFFYSTFRLDQLSSHVPSSWKLSITNISKLVLNPSSRPPVTVSYNCLFSWPRQ